MAWNNVKESDSLLGKLSCFPLFRVRGKPSREANLDHAYYTSSSSREFKLHHLVLEFLNLLIMLSVWSNSSHADLRRITEKQWKNLGFEGVQMRALCWELLTCTKCRCSAKRCAQCCRYVVSLRTQGYLHFMNYRGQVTCQVYIAPSGLWPPILVSGFKAQTFSSTTTSVLFRFLELLWLSLLTIPKLHCITYSSSILIELNIRDVFEYCSRKFKNSLLIFLKISTCKEPFLLL